jgi:hypothetical protein
MRGREKTLAELCVNAPDMDPGSKNYKKTSIRDCIRLYNITLDTKRDMSINKSKFNNISREVLLATLVYLGGPNMSDFTKPAIIDSVIARIDHHLPHCCYTCKEEYTIPQGVKSLLDCSKCGRGVHDQCFLKQIKHPAANDNSISPNPNDIMKQYVNPLEITGITYLCGSCHKSFIPSPDSGKYKRLKDKPTNAAQAAEVEDDSTSDKISENVTENEQDDHDDDPPPVLIHALTGLPLKPHQASCKSKISQNDMPLHQPNSESSVRPICRFYTRNKCKHGLSGKGCNFAHPKRCQKYAAHGTNHGGCKKGSECNLFHPRLCHDSVKYKLCTNPDCTYTHIKGTKRSDPNSQENEIDSYVQEYENSNTKPRNEYDNTSEHFLGLLNNLKHELFQMMDQRLNQLHPKQPPVVPFHAPPQQDMMPQLYQPNHPHPQQLGTQNIFQQMQPQFTQTNPAQNVNNWPIPMRH